MCEDVRGCVQSFAPVRSVACRLHRQRGSDAASGKQSHPTPCVYALPGTSTRIYDVPVQQLLKRE